MSATALPAFIAEPAGVTDVATHEAPSGLVHIARWLGRCPGCDSSVTETYRSGEAPAGWQTERTRQGHCDCGHPYPVKVRQVRGRISPVKCAAKCQNATGDDCTCECFGTNHGAGALWGFRRVSDSAARRAEYRAAAKARRRERLAEIVATWATDHPELEALAEDRLPDHLAGIDFLVSLHAQLHIKGSLSDGQVAAGTAAIRRVVEAPPLVEVPVRGRVEVEGTIAQVTVGENEWGTTYRMTVIVPADGGQWKLNTTMPKALHDQAHSEDRSAREWEGSEVRLRVTVEPRDVGFAFGRRPTLL